jgi:hypothetical protein
MIIQITKTNTADHAKIALSITGVFTKDEFISTYIGECAVLMRPLKSA